MESIIVNNTTLRGYHNLAFAVIYPNIPNNLCEVKSLFSRYFEKLSSASTILEIYFTMNTILDYLSIFKDTFFNQDFSSLRESVIYYFDHIISYITYIELEHQVVY